MDSKLSNNPVSSDPLNKNNEPFPVNKGLRVLKGLTMFKTSKWWEAILLVETAYEQQQRAYKKVIWYRWQWKKIKKFGTNEEYMGWSRKEHKAINFPKNWEDAQKVIAEYVKELPP